LRSLRPGFAIGSLYLRRLHRRGKPPLGRRGGLSWSRRAGRIGDRRDYAILQLGGRLGPRLLGLEQHAQLIELGTLIGRQRLDLLAGQIRDPVLVASAQPGSLLLGGTAERPACLYQSLRKQKTYGSH
jgi:hypothetical protein